MEGLTDDGFLGRRVRVWQPREGYRAATDPVLLAAAVPAVAGERVLELGCGVGVASLCLAARVPGLALAGLERQAEYAALARRNAERNGIALEVVEGDLAAMPEGLRRSFDQVMANPPYWPAGGGTAARDAGREAARREETPLAEWVAAGARRLAPGGRLTLILAAERLPELLAACSGRLGSLVLLPLAGREGREAGRVILQARKGGRAKFRLLAPFVLHEGVGHGFSPLAEAVLRDGARLPIGG